MFEYETTYTEPSLYLSQALAYYRNFLSIEGGDSEIYKIDEWGRITLNGTMRRFDITQCINFMVGDRLIFDFPPLGSNELLETIYRNFELTADLQLGILVFFSIGRDVLYEIREKYSQKNLSPEVMNDIERIIDQAKRYAFEI